MSRPALAWQLTRGGLVGAACGAAVGVLATVVRVKGQMHAQSQTQDPDLHRRIINLPHAPDAQEAVQRMTDYKVLNPEAIDAIQLNLDRLVGIYILLSGSAPVSVSYELKASRYRANIEAAIRQLTLHYQGREPSKQLMDDVDSLLKCTDNYMHNIRQMMHEKFKARQVKPQ